MVLTGEKSNANLSNNICICFCEARGPKPLILAVRRFGTGAVTVMASGVLAFVYSTGTEPPDGENQWLRYRCCNRDGEWCTCIRIQRRRASGIGGAKQIICDTRECDRKKAARTRDCAGQSAVDCERRRPGRSLGNGQLKRFVRKSCRAQ